MRDSARAALRAIGRAAPAAAAVGLLLAFNALFTPGFFDLSVIDGRLTGSLVDVLNRGAIVVLLALGMALVIATGGVDLSVGAVMAIAGATAATLVAQHGTNSWAAIAAALAVGAAAGAFNGTLVAGAGVQPIVATLVLMVAGRGAAQLLTGGQIVTFNDPILNFIDGGFIAGVPMPALIAAGALTLGVALTRGTALGLFTEATGDNERAARLAGVRVRVVKASAYVLCGAAAAVAGLLAASDIRAADANNAGLLSHVAHSLGITDTIIAWNTFSEDEAVLAAYAAQAGAAAEGDHAAMSYRRTQDMPGYGTFNTAYQAAGFPNYGDEAMIWGAYAYDAAKIIIAAIGRAQSTDPNDIRDAIASTINYQGVVGIYEGFDAKGDVIPQWAWLERYTNGQWIILHPSKVFLPTTLKNFGQ